MRERSRHGGGAVGPGSWLESGHHSGLCRYYGGNTDAWHRTQAHNAGNDIPSSPSRAGCQTPPFCIVTSGGFPHHPQTPHSVGSGERGPLRAGQMGWEDPGWTPCLGPTASWAPGGEYSGSRLVDRCGVCWSGLGLGGCQGNRGRAAAGRAACSRVSMCPSTGSGQQVCVGSERSESPGQPWTSWRGP